MFINQNRSRISRGLMFMLCVVLLLVGCAPTGSSVASVPSPGTTVSAPVVSASKKAVVGIQQDFDSLDPHLYRATGTEEVMFNIFSGLVNTDSGGVIIPALAESWKISEDQLSYTFVLKPDLYFHNGDPVRPEDVKYSIERLQGKVGEHDKPLSSSFNAVSEVYAETPNIVRFELSQTDASLLSKLIAAIIPAGSGSEQAQHPLGAGPFKFVSYTPGVGIKMEKFAQFYQPGLPKLDEVEFRIFTDSNAAFLALQNQEIDIWNVTLDQREVLNKDQFEVISTPQNMPQLLALNLEYEPFTDLRVRQALNYAVNKDEIIEMLAPGSQKLGTNFCEVMAFYAEKGLEDTYPFNPERAKELLAEAGYSDLKFAVRVPSNYDFHVNTAQIMQSQLKQVGVTMDIELVDWDTWLSEVYNGFKHQATLVGLTGKLDPDSVLGRFSSTHRNNFMRYNNPEVDQLLLDGKATAIAEERAPIYKEIQTILAKEVPAVFIMDITLYRAVNKRLTTLPTYPIGYIDMKSVDVR